MSTWKNATKPFAWGIIGTGSSARDFASDLQYVTERACFVKAVLGAEGSSELEDFAEQHHVPLTYFDMQSFLEESQVDAIFIAAPAPFRYPYAIRCLQGGMPVLCEAPLALSAAQAEMLAEVSKRTGAFLMEGMPLRFLPSIYAVLSLLYTGAIGDIISVKASLTGKTGEEDPEAMPGNGALLNLGSYPLFLSLLLLGEPESIKAAARMTDQGTDECCTCLFTYPDGKYAHIECSELSDIKDQAVITGSEGVITLHDQWHRQPESISIAVTGELPVRRESRWEGSGYQYEVAETLRCLEDQRHESDVMTHSVSVRTAEVLEEIRRQLRVGAMA